MFNMIFLSVVAYLYRMLLVQAKFKLFQRQSQNDINYADFPTIFENIFFCLFFYLGSKIWTLT